VGLVVFYDANDEFLWRCSGTLLTPLVFLTAGHCTSPDAEEGTPVSARVYFQQDAGVHYDPTTEFDPVTGYPDTCLPKDDHPLCVTSHELHDFDYANAGYPDTHDLGLVILDESPAVSTFGALAGPGTLDRLATKRGLQDLGLTASGYGVTDAREHPASRATSFRERLMAQVRLVNLRSANTAGFNLQTSASPGGGRGGTCYGDSGGPLFYPATSNVVVSVTSFGLSPWCTGVDFSYRVDTQEAIDWIRTTVPTSEVAKIVVVNPTGQTATQTNDAKSAVHKQGKDRAHKRSQGKNRHRQ
jgi:hypothetical protein